MHSPTAFCSIRFFCKLGTIRYDTIRWYLRASIFLRFTAYTHLAAYGSLPQSGNSTGCVGFCLVYNNVVCVPTYYSLFISSTTMKVAAVIGKHTNGVSRCMITSESTQRIRHCAKENTKFVFFYICPNLIWAHFAWVVDDAKCIVVTRVCVSVCLSVCLCPSVCVSVRGRMPTLLHGPGCNSGSDKDAP